MDPLSGEQWMIAWQGHEAVVVEVGGGLRAYSVDGSALLDGYDTDEICPGGAGQQLAPWPNRIGDGRYTFDGRNVQTAVSEPDKGTAIHGLVRWLKWRPIDRAADAITLECDLAAQPGYPWPLLLTTRWSLGPDGLLAEHSATNTGAARCPFGFGVHPYLQVPGVAVDDLVLALAAETRLLVDERALPVGDEPVAGSGYDFGAAIPIGDRQLDTAYTGLRRNRGNQAAARLTAGGAGVELWLDGSFGWLQVFTGDTLPPPRRRRSVAIEPMTCPPDAFRTGRDLVVLEPGQTWRGRWGLRPVRA